MYQQRIKCILSLALTLGIIHATGNSLFTLFFLLPVWYFFFYPWSKTELIMFIIASLFIIGQNYFTLQAGGFTFNRQDFLLMPYYEPLLWGFYYMNIKRFIADPSGSVLLTWKAVFGLIITGLVFSISAGNSDQLTLAAAASTAALLLMFHQKYDLLYGGYALILGIIVELFGVWTGHWSYPSPDLLGIPFWFAPMWISVGILGRRLLVPLSAWTAAKITLH